MDESPLKNHMILNAEGFKLWKDFIAEITSVRLAMNATAGGQAFFILETSDKGRNMPGALPVAAVAGFNPYVVVGKLAASSSGIADITQQQRMADEIARAVAEAVRLHVVPPARERQRCSFRSNP